jgi:hypothetical protein
MADTDAPDHETRVRDAFDSLQRKVGDRLDDEGRLSLEGLRAAAASRDAAKLREGLTGVRQTHGWLYRELAEHPSVANLLNELALWGF